MGTLLKYEFRRSRIIFLGIAAITLFVEILYLIGWGFKIKPLFAIGLIGGILCLALGATAILLYGVIMFNDDISKKPGYLLFSTPRSSAQIVGAKLLMTLLALLGISILFFLLIALDVWLGLERSGTSIVTFLSMIDTSVTEAGMKEAIFNGYNIFGLCMYILSSIISFVFNVIVAYVVMVLLKTIMGNQKGRTMLGIILWFVITNAISTLSGFISMWLTPNRMNDEITVAEVLVGTGGVTFSSVNTIEEFLHTIFHPAMYLPPMIICIICCAIGYWLTTWMIDKKLSV